MTLFCFSKFLRNYRQFGHAPSESFASPNLGSLKTYRPWPCRSADALPAVAVRACLFSPDCNNISHCSASYLFPDVPIHQAIVIIPLIATSTGITWARYSLLPYIERMTPFPPPTNSPIGPFRLSTQPGTGSFHVGTTATTKIAWQILLHSQCVFKYVSENVKDIYCQILLE